MSAATVELTLHLILCAANFWSCFFRQQRSTSQTRGDIRAVFWLLAVASLMLGVAPWGHALWPWLFEPYRVTWPELLMLAAVAAVQEVTARHWRHGVPQDFVKE